MALNIRYQNTRGLRTKVDEFRLNLMNSDADIHILTETWLNHNFHSSEYIQTEFVSHRRDRNYSVTNTTQGGGCWVLHKPELNVVRRYDLESDIAFVEDIWTEVKLSDSDDRLLICVVYITSMPNNENLYSAFTDSCRNSLARLNSNDRILIVGDFNVSNIKWDLCNGILQPSLSQNCNKSIEVLDLISFGNLRQHNSHFNRNNGILDLVLSSDPLSAIKVNESLETLVGVDDYHPPLDISVAIKVKYMPNINHRRYNFRRADYNAINNAIENTNWKFLNEIPLNPAVQKFYDVLNEIIHTYVPPFKNKQTFPPWFDCELKNLLKQKEKARKKLKRINTLENYVKYSDLRRLCKRKIDGCHKDYLNHIQSNMKSNIKLFWSYSKARRKTNSYPTQFKYEDRTVSKPKDVCELFADFFRSTYNTNHSDRNFNIDLTSNPLTENPIKITPIDIINTIAKLDLNKNGGPDGIPNYFLRQVGDYLSIPLTIIFNRSLNESIFPTAFKNSSSTAIFKKGDESDISNYRQVCMANTIAIVFEKIINKYLLSKLAHKLTKNQHGFVRNKSTNTNLVEYVDCISSALDDGHEVHTIYTDFSKAFDSVDHNILLSKLSTLGIDTTILLWLNSYLKDRKVQVIFNGQKSQPFTPGSGVPQGSVLGPLLFNIFINDLSQLLNNLHLLFADDLKIFRIIKSENDMMELQEDLDRLHDWTITNKLKLNIDKCCTMAFSIKQNPTPASYNINGIELTEVNKMKDLGVIFDKKLKFDSHIEEIVKKSYSMLGFLMRTTSNFDNKDCVRFLFNALVRSRLEYNSAVWNPYQNTYSSKIERVQKKYTRFVFYKFQVPYISYPERLKTLNMIELVHRREYFDICLLHRIMHDQSLVQSNRPLLRISRFTSRYNQKFNPKTARTNYGLHVNPTIRIQLLFNRKFNNIDILGQTSAVFKESILRILSIN